MNHTQYLAIPAKAIDAGIIAAGDTRLYGDRVAQISAAIAAALPHLPAPGVPDVAVEAACQRMYGLDVWERMHAAELETKRGWMRFALEAAQPFMAPDPQSERALMAAGVISAAAAQRALADKAKTSHGEADYTDNAEWLEEFAEFLLKLG